MWMAHIIIVFYVIPAEYKLLPTTKKCLLKITGAPLSGAGRVQMNLEVEPVKQIPILANLPKMIFPVVWMDESADIPDDIIKIIKYAMYM